MKTIALCAIAVALLIMAAVEVYESPEMVCARHRDRALAGFAQEPMNKSRYRVHLVETIAKGEGKAHLAAEVQAMNAQLADFDAAYQKYQKDFAIITAIARSTVEDKFAACRGDWKMKRLKGAND